MKITRLKEIVDMSNIPEYPLCPDCYVPLMEVKRVMSRKQESCTHQVLYDEGCTSLVCKNCGLDTSLINRSERTYRGRVMRCLKCFELWAVEVDE